MRTYIVLTAQAAAKGPKLRRPEGCRDLARSVRTAVQQFAAEHGGIASDDSPFPRYWCAPVCGPWGALCHISCQGPTYADCGDECMAPLLLLDSVIAALLHSVGGRQLCTAAFLSVLPTVDVGSLGRAF